MTREKLKVLLQEYGRVAVWTYLVLWLLVLAFFTIGIAAGFRAESGAAGLGIIGAGWVATKLTQPLRIAATLALTPLLAAALKKWRGKTAAESPSAEQPPTQR